jgi:hypothetical protein
VAIRSIKDETGKRYGRLLVESRDASMYRGRAAWLCRCDCGVEIRVGGESLRSGNTTSCGCYQRERNRLANSLPFGISGMRRAVDVMRRNANTRGIDWLLADDVVQHLIKQDCFYCGAQPSNTSYGRNGSYRYNGLDRLDSNGCYRVDNVVPCCGACNKAKMTMSVPEFAAWIRRAFEHFAKQGE